MWIVEWSNLSDYEWNVTAWVSEDEALKSACSDIINHINRMDIDSDDELLTAAEVINGHVKNKKYRAIINHWNDCSFNVDHSDGAQYWTVRHITQQRFYGDIPTLSLDTSDEIEETVNQPSVTNDHTCTLCGNDKCSKREKSCWKCGSPI